MLNDPNNSKFKLLIKKLLKNKIWNLLINFEKDFNLAEEYLKNHKII